MQQQSHLITQQGQQQYKHQQQGQQQYQQQSHPRQQEERQQQNNQARSNDICNIINERTGLQVPTYHVFPENGSLSYLCPVR